MTRKQPLSLTALKAFLLLLLAAFPARIEAQSTATRCNERLYERYHRGGPDDVQTIARRMCEEAGRGTLPESGVPYEIAVELRHAARTDPARLRLWIDQVQKGLLIADAALVKLGSDSRITGRERPRGTPLFERKKVFVILSSTNLRRYPDSDAFADYIDGDCYLVIVPNALSLLGEDGALAFVMSHELFHCVQNYSVRDLDRTTESEDWWIESSAHWFAHIAQPLAVVETYSKSVNKFERESHRKTLNRFPYSLWPFFAWYANEHGNAHAVMRLLKRMPEGRHDANTIAGLLTPEEWGRFARAYSAYQIKVSDRVPVDPRPRARLRVTNISLPEIGDARDYRFRRRTGALERYRITLHPGDWELSTGSEGAMYLAPMPEGGGDPAPEWKEISAAGSPLSLSVPCEEERDFALVGFGSAEGSPPFVLKARKKGDPCKLSCKNITESRDPCLAGVWEDTERVITRDLRRRMDALAARARAAGGRLKIGDPIITFSPENGIVTTDMKISGAARAMKAETQARGTARWATSGGRLLLCPQGVKITTTVSAGGRSRTTRRNMPADASWKEKIYRYECSEGRLRLTDAETGVSGAMHRR